MRAFPAMVFPPRGRSATAAPSIAEPGRRSKGRPGVPEAVSPPCWRGVAGGGGGGGKGGGGSLRVLPRCRVTGLGSPPPFHRTAHPSPPQNPREGGDPGETH